MSDQGERQAGRAASGAIPSRARGAALVLARSPLSVLRRPSVTPYLFVAPMFVVFVVFVLVPIVWAFVLSFQAGRVLTGYRFVGLANFETIIHDRLFWSALKHSLYYAGVIIPSVIVLALVLAVFLNQRVRFRGLFAALIILPALTSPVAASVIWVYLLQTDGGIFNSVLGWFGVGPVNWLGDPDLVIPVVSLVEIWRSVPFYAILFVAGMQSIPSRLYDAVAIDGASRLQAYFRVTLPLMRPVILFALLMASIWTLQIFDTPEVMTKGGPADTSLSLVEYMYRVAFSYDTLGAASAMSLILMAIVLALAALQLRLFKRELEY